MDKTIRYLPPFNEGLFKLWGLHASEKKQFLDSMSLANELIGISERHFGGAEFEAASWRDYSHDGLLTGRASYLRQHFEWDFTLEERRQPVIESLGRLSASYNFYTAFGELHLSKFYALTFGFLQSLNDNNVLSASMVLRSLFEVVGTFSSYTSAELPFTSDAGDISKIRIKKILDVMLTRKKGYVSEENYLDLSKLAIDQFFEELEGRNNRLGRKIYSFLCNFTHPSYLSNDFLLQFYGRDSDTWSVEYQDAADKGYSWSVAFDYEMPPQIGILIGAFRFLLLCFIKSVRMFYMVPIIQFSIISAHLLLPRIGEEEGFDESKMTELYVSFEKLKSIVDATIGFDGLDDEEVISAFKSGEFDDLITRALDFFENGIVSYWKEMTEFSANIDEENLSEDLDYLKYSLRIFN